MAITDSLGYGGTITEDDIPRWGRSFDARYGVISAGDWKVTAKAGVDRTVGIAAGDGFGHKVIDTNDAEVTKTFATLSSGTRYDLVVARRDWSGAGGTTTFAVVTGTASSIAAFATRNRNPGVLDDQPLAVVQVIGGVGGGVLGTVSDVRVWQSGSGAVALDALALQYLDDIGTSVRIGQTIYQRILDGSGGPVWDLRPATIPVSGTGTLTASTVESVVSGCTVTLPAGTYDITATGFADWSVAGAGPRYIMRLRSGGVGGTLLQESQMYIGGVLVGSMPATLLKPALVVASSLAVVLTVEVTGPSGGTTLFKNAVVNAVRVA